MAINLTKNAEEISKQLLDINRKYINKSMGVIGKLKDFSPKEKITNIDQNMISDVFGGIVKLNLEYYSKLVDFGFAVTDQILFSNPKQTEEETTSSFTLTGTGKPGSSVELQFVLDNSKTETVTCTLENSVFINIDDQSETSEINLSFEPQSFELKEGQSQTIQIKADLSKKISDGTFFSHVKVAGFEPAYFTVVIHVEKPISNARKKNQPVEKN